MKFTAAACITVVALAAATAIGSTQERPLHPRAGPRVFWVQGCYGCHTLGGAYGTPIAADLSRIGLRYTEEELVRWLEDPRAVRPSAHMPKLELRAEDIRALAAFLATQGRS